MQLTASGTASTYLWEDNSTSNPRIVSPNTTRLYSVTGTSGSCSNTAIVTVQVTQPTPLIALSATSPALIQPLVLSSSNCPITFSGLGWGKSFVITGPNGYVFSNVFREFIQGGPISATGINQPDSYTLTVYGDPDQTPVSYSFQVTGTGCK